MTTDEILARRGLTREDISELQITMGCNCNQFTPNKYRTHIHWGKGKFALISGSYITPDTDIDMLSYFDIEFVSYYSPPNDVYLVKRRN